MIPRKAQATLLRLSQQRTPHSFHKVAPWPSKKTEPYSSLWKSCDELRGGMDASQYKYYVLIRSAIGQIAPRSAYQANRAGYGTLFKFEKQGG